MKHWLSKQSKLKLIGTAGIVFVSLLALVLHFAGIASFAVLPLMLPFTAMLILPRNRSVHEQK